MFAVSVIVPSLAEKGASVTVSTLELWALEFVTKPDVDVHHELSCYADELKGKV